MPADPASLLLPAFLSNQPTCLPFHPVSLHDGLSSLSE
jgi:hypothetical protein